MPTLLLHTLVLLSNVSLPYRLASEECKNYNAKPATLEVISQYLAGNDRVSVWQPIIKVKHQNWRWIRGPGYQRTLSDPTTDNKNQECAVFRSRDNFLDEVECNQGNFDFLCEADDCSSIEKRSEFPIISMTPVGNYCYVFYRAEVSWYEAKTYCATRGMQLASFTPDVTAVKQKLHDQLEEVHGHGHFWIGLTRMNWQLQTNSIIVEGPIAVSRYFWVSGDPHPDHACATAIWSNHSVLWRGEECSSNRSFLCQYDSKEASRPKIIASDTTTETSLTSAIPSALPFARLTKPSRDDEPSLQFYVLLSLMIGLCILFIIFFVIVMVRFVPPPKNPCNSSKATSNTSSSSSRTSNPQIETDELTPLSAEPQISKLPNC